MTTSHYIAGHWVEGQGSDCISVNDPALGLPFAELMAASVAQVDQAVAAARAALPAWKQTSASERAAYLRGFAEQLGQRREALITLQMRNNGKPRHEAEIDLDDAIATFNYYADLAEQLPEKNRDVPLAAPGFSARTRLEPVGVVGLIVPWNFPLVTSAWKLAPALAAGCTVVLKPSEVTPLIEQAYGQIADAVGLPAGVLNIVNGKAETGAALSSHNGLDKLSFTGSNSVGSQVMRSASAQCRPVTLELGGKSAIMVFDDCDVDQAVEWIVAGISWNAGQMCSATSRLLVQEGIADALLPRLQHALETLRVGNPLTEEVDMGPLTSQAQWLKVASYFATAREEGCIAWPVAGRWIAMAGLSARRCTPMCQRTAACGPKRSLGRYCAHVASRLKRKRLPKRTTAALASSPPSVRPTWNAPNVWPMRWKSGMCGSTRCRRCSSKHRGAAQRAAGSGANSGLGGCRGICR